MSDRIVLSGCSSRAATACTRGAGDAQPFEVDVELVLDLQPAGVPTTSRRPSTTGPCSRSAARSSRSTSFHLIEALAEAIADELLAGFPARQEVTVRVRKPQVPLDGTWPGRRGDPRAGRRARGG